MPPPQRYTSTNQQADHSDLVDAVTDNGAGPVSATFPAISATGWGPAALLPADGNSFNNGCGASPDHYLLHPVPQLRHAAANATGTVTSKDAANNTIECTLTLTNDSTAATRGDQLPQRADVRPNELVKPVESVAPLLMRLQAWHRFKSRSEIRPTAPARRDGRVHGHELPNCELRERSGHHDVELR